MDELLLEGADLGEREDHLAMQGGGNKGGKGKGERMCEIADVFSCVVS